MPSVNEIIERVSRLKPVSGVEERDMARWLMQLDGRIYAETTSKDDPQKTPPAKWPEDGDKELLVPEEYSEVYVYWLIAQMEVFMREYGNYNNTITLYNNAMDNYMAYYRRTHIPQSTGGFKNFMN